MVLHLTSPFHLSTEISVYYVLGTILNAGVTAMNKETKISAFMKLIL